MLDSLGLAAASAGTHPSADWHEIRVSAPERHQEVYGSMRALARREPTFALHVHVGLPTGEAGIAAFNRLRAHVPLLLALSANSPFWQGRDTGLASARTPLFQAFPRVGIPRAFGSYGEYVRAVDLLLDCEAIPDPTYLWWDVRPQPKLGTVEVRIMDSQSTLDRNAALVALVQALTRLELVDGHVDAALVHSPEVLDENRFLAARDGIDARFVDPVKGARRVRGGPRDRARDGLRTARRGAGLRRGAGARLRAARRGRACAPAPPRGARRPRRPGRRSRRGLPRRHHVTPTATLAA